MSRLIIYHNADLDGICSAAIVKRYSEDKDCELLGIDYGQEFELDSVDGRDVVMVDFCLEPFEQMLEIDRRASRFTWIDHHKTAIEELHKHEVDPPGIRAVGIAGCELAWQWFAPGDEPAPIAVRFLGRYDVWDHKYDSHVLPFQYGMRCQDGVYQPTSPIWHDVLRSSERFIEDIVKQGFSILKYQSQMDAKVMDAQAFYTSFGPERFYALVVNGTAAHNSKLFDSWKNRMPEASLLINFYWKDNQWTVELYRPEGSTLDVGAMAKQYGGGGHPGAAGFQSNNLPFAIKPGFDVTVPKFSSC